MVDLNEDTCAELDGFGAVVVGEDSGGSAADVGIAFEDCDLYIGTVTGVAVEVVCCGCATRAGPC